MCELELRVERSYLFLAHYFSILVVCTPLARCTGEALGEYVIITCLVGQNKVIENKTTRKGPRIGSELARRAKPLAKTSFKQNNPEQEANQVRNVNGRNIAKAGQINSI